MNQVIEDIRATVKKSGIVEKAFLFGSYARNEQTENSDIDICLELNCSISDIRVYELRVSLNQVCDYNCDICFYNRIGEKLKEEIDLKGKVIYVQKESESRYIGRKNIAKI